MIFEFIIALLLGILMGTFTGLFPGIHINLVASFLVPLSAALPIPVYSLVTFIVSMSITHTFLDFIPSIFLGAPEEDTFLSVLPGHRLLSVGRGQEAVIITLYGSIIAIVIACIFSPVLIIVMPIVVNYLKYAIPFVLIFISLYLIIREEKIFLSLIILILAGALGYVSLGLPIKQPLLPLLTGLFGTSSMLISLKNKNEIKKQLTFKLKEVKPTKTEIFSSSLAAMLTAPVLSFFPAVGSGQAAFIGSEIVPQTDRSFLLLNGMINTIVMVLSFVVLYAIGKSRTGSAAAVQELLTEINLNTLIIIIFVAIISACIAFFIGLFISRNFSYLLNKINYKILTIIIIITLIVITFIFSGYLGIIILISSTALGLYTISTDVKRINLMGCLLIPTIIYYLI